MRNTIMASALAAGLLVGIAGTASAEQPGPYVSLGVGANWLQDADVTGTGINDKAKFDDGWAALGAVGYAFDKNWRTELELGYRRNGIDSISGGGASNGNVNAFSFMVNALYDIDTGTKWTPYLGVGIGMVRYKAAGVNTSNTTNINDSDNVLAGQGILGIAYDVSPNAQLFLDYHYLQADDPSVTNSAGVGIDTEYKSHTVMVGLRYSFGTPPAPAAAPMAAAAPAPAPAPAPAIVRSFQVFFDFDKSDIRMDAQPIIEEAAKNARQGGVSKITLTGHTDAAGTAAYNQKLSERRAAAVKAALVKMGFKAEDIVTVGKGKADQLVPTADGVREPKNRRVEIVF
jgi:outer membrane protein OmpA-like peptidoglycan-associated protein